MCLAVPLKIVSIEGKNAQGEIDGIKRKIRIDFLPRISIGEYVLVHAGFAIEKLTAKAAEDNLKAIREVEDALSGYVQRKA
ncbi:MAG TPA: HypC/HybG/HupF family hydrogenase formation chaperone [Clostridiaceae bacterium]|nr:HypC/HybG/HupF family hydrogenase formation chaperone [Clostridiaceae bacterium]